ncbi:MAG: sulfite exporter TauE/SafE family protein [Planctomycetes bacterium]|nr:sulfite exporter TauE/SafE family protein [Planctomycetota bacterium]
MTLELLILALGCAISFLSGLLGIGGGIVLAPALLFLPPLLGMDPLDMKSVSGLTITQGLFACLSGALRHDKYRVVHHRLVRWMGGSIFASALAGALLSGWLPDETVTAVFAGLAAIAAILIWLPAREPADAGASATSEFNLPMALAIALAVGLLSGLVGQGGSFILIPLMLRFLRLPTRIVIGSNLALAVFSSLAGFVGKLVTGQIPLLPAMAIVAGAIPAAQLGGACSQRARPRWLRLCLAVLIMLAAIKMLADLPHGGH